MVSTGVNRGQEAAPIVVGDTMYVVTPFPNILYCLDLRNNGAAKCGKTDYSGSAVVEVALYDADGTMRASEVFQYHTGFRKFKTGEKLRP